MKGDNKAQIKMCLSCVRPKCTNCLHDMATGRRQGKPPRKVVGWNATEHHLFESVYEAAAFIHMSVCSIRDGIWNGKAKAGYFWRYEE